MKQDGTKENPIIGLATIVTNGDLILIGYDGNKGKWSFPGGHWEPEMNESFEEGSARETFEETGGSSGIQGCGIKCKNFTELYNHTFFREDKKLWYQSIGFVAEHDSGNLTDDLSEQRTDWKFMGPKEALLLDLFEPARKGLEIFIEKQSLTQKI